MNMKDILKIILRNIWILPTAIMGLNGLPLIYVGLKAKKHKWICIGAILEIPFILTIITGMLNLRVESFDILIGGGLVFAIPVAIIYSLHIRKEYMQFVEQEEEIEKRVRKEIRNKQEADQIHENVVYDSQNVFDYDGGETTESFEKININTASAEEINDLPGVNIILAKKLENERDMGIRIKDMDQLAQIWDLTPHHRKQLEKYVEFDVEEDNEYKRRLDI